jgi:hypothetical protein
LVDRYRRSVDWCRRLVDWCRRFERVASVLRLEEIISSHTQ